MRESLMLGAARIALLGGGLWSAAAAAGAADNGQPVDIGSVDVTAQDGAAAAAPPSATGTRAQALELKKDAPNVIEVQPAEQIRKLPDVSVAEALQRIPGISMESDTGEGRFINIRGLDADLNATSFAGVHLPANNQASPLGGSRAVAMDSFPAGFIGGLEVVKSLTPDMSAEGLGGSINILPFQMPADGKPFANLDMAFGIEALRPTYRGQVNTEFGGTFGADATSSFITNPKPFGLLGALSVDADSRAIDDVEEDYANPVGNGKLPLQDLQLRWYQYKRVREGGYGEFTFQPNETSKFYFRALSTGYTEYAEKHYLRLDGLDGSNGALTVNPDGTFTATDATARQYRIDSKEKIETDLVMFGGETLIADRVKVETRTAFVTGYDQFYHSYSAQFAAASPFTVTYDTSNPAARSFSVLTPGVSLNNPAQFNLKSITNTPSKASDNEISNNEDFTIPVTLISPDDAIKTGFAVRWRNRSVDQFEYDASLSGNPSLSAYTTGGNQVYYNGLYNIGPNIKSSIDSFPGAAFNQNISTYYGGYARDSETVTAGYGLYQTKFDRLSVQAGLRVEMTHATDDAYIATTDAAGNTSYALNGVHHDYTNLFPSVQAKYELTKDWQVRAAFSTGIARPGFQQISAAKSVDLGQLTVTQGNPNLAPTTGRSYDLTSEYFLPGGGLLAGGAFYKTFDNYIAGNSVFGSYQGQPGYLITTFQNIGGAVARGFEGNLIYPFLFLPHPFNGLGFEGNWTYVDSSGQLRPGEKKEPLPETSPQNFNLALFYTKGPIDLRVAASYVSENLWAIGGSRDTDIFSQPRMRVDLAASYQVLDNARLYFQVKNLTNTPLEFTQGQGGANPIQREFYDATYLFGLKTTL